MSNYKKEEILALYDRHETITGVAREYCQKANIPYSDSVRRAVSRIVNESIDKGELQESVSETNQYRGVAGLSALKEDGKVMSIDEWCEVYGIPRDQVKSYKLVTHTGKGAYYNVASSVVAEDVVEDYKRELIELVGRLARPEVKIERNVDLGSEAGELLVISLADVHIGKLSEVEESGDEYNSAIAIKRVLTGVSAILRDVSSLKIDKILLIGGNDILHTDNAKRTTTSGTPQDTDGGWFRNFVRAKELYVKVIDMLLEVADVHFVHNPSNHDFVTGTLLAQVVEAFYRNHRNFTCDVNLRHRKYFRYYSNLIGSTHGDGAKSSDLPLLMAQESEDWSSTKHRYFYTHHVHHKNEKDYPGVTVESFRSPSSSDSWHDRNGFTGAPKALEAFVHHPVRGRRIQITHIF